MNIELLNVRIFITKNEVTVDAIGNHKASRVPYYSCYATISAEAGKAKTGNTTDATTYADWYKAVYVPAAEIDVATQSQSAAKPAKAVKE